MKLNLIKLYIVKFYPVKLKNSARGQPFKFYYIKTEPKILIVFLKKAKLIKIVNYKFY